MGQRIGDAIRADESQALSAPALVDRVAETEAAWEILRERVPGAKVIEFAYLLVAFEGNRANGSGALYFNANHGQSQEWGVRSDSVERVGTTLTRKGKRV